jgi:RNA polymerase sigma factor (sigma-70 family)
MLSRIVLRTQSDETLAQLASRGSDAAFEAIVQRYRRPLLGYCRRLLLSDSHSEDVVQQTFLNAWTALRRQTEVRDLKPWLYRITHNQAMSALRRPGWDFAELNESLLNRDARGGELDGRIVMRETLAAVAALPGLQRDVILRTAIEGRSYEEVAGDLGVSEESVRGLVYRARATLRAGFAVAAPEGLVLWAAGLTRRCASSRWLPEVLSGGGSAGGAAVVVKGAAVLASSATVIGGSVGFVFKSHPPPAHHTAHGVLARRVLDQRAAVAFRAGSELGRHELPGRTPTARTFPAARTAGSSTRHLLLVAASTSARATTGKRSAHAQARAKLPAHGPNPSGSSSNQSQGRSPTPDSPQDVASQAPMRGDARAAPQGTANTNGAAPTTVDSPAASSGQSSPAPRSATETAAANGNRSNPAGSAL